MPTTPTASVAVSWNFDNAASDEVVTVLHFVKVGDASPFDAADLATLILDAGNSWSDTIGLVVTQDLNAVSVTAREVVTGAGFSVTLDPPEGTWLNTDTGESMPPWENVVVNHQSTAPGRSGRGRTFLPGCRASFVDSSGTVSALFRQQLVTAWNDFDADLQAVGKTLPSALVVYSRTNDTVSTVIGHAVKPIVGIQRDRRAGSQ